MSEAKAISIFYSNTRKGHGLFQRKIGTKTSIQSQQRAAFLKWAGRPYFPYGLTLWLLMETHLRRYYGTLNWNMMQNATLRNL